MNAIPLINNAPRPNINVGSIGSPAFNPVAAGAKLGGSIGGNVMRQNPASMPVNNEAQLRQEVNTSIVALKREAFSLENLITQAAQTLQDINKRLSELEGKQGDYVKKSDVVDSITSGDMNPVTSNAVANSNAMPVNSVTSGNMHSVTSNAVYNNFLDKYKQSKDMGSGGSAIIQSSTQNLFGCAYLISFSRDNVGDCALGFLYWTYNQGFGIKFIVSPESSRYTVSLTRNSVTKATITTTSQYELRISIIDLNGKGYLTLS